MPETGRAPDSLAPLSTLDVPGEGIVVLDEAGRVAFVTQAGAALLGYASEHLLDQPLHDLVHHHRADGTPYPYAECPVAAVLRDGRPRTAVGDAFWRAGDGMLAVDLRATPVYTDGVVTGAVVVFTDAGQTVTAGGGSARSGSVAGTAGPATGPAGGDPAVGITVVGLDGRYLQANAVACELLGRTEAQLRALTVCDVTHPEDEAATVAALRSMARGDIDGYRVEKRYLRPGGEVVHALLQSTLVRAPDRGPRYYFSRLVDLTDERRAVAALRRDAERTARIVELCDRLAEGATDERELLQDAARLVARIVGDAATVWVTGDDETSPRAVCSWHPDPRALAELDRGYRLESAGVADAVLRSGEPVEIRDFQRERLAPEWERRYGRWLDTAPVRSLVAVPLRSRGRTVGALAVVRAARSAAYTREDVALVKDIANRVALALDNARLFRIARDAERAVWTSEQRHRALVQQSADVIMILDEHGHIGYATPSAVVLFGHDPVVDRPSGVSSLFCYVHPDDLPAVESAFAATIAGRRTPEIMEFRVRHRDGGWRYVEVSGTNLLAEPAVGGVVVNLRDITERRRVAEQQAAVAALGQWALSGTALAELLEAAAALVARTLELPLCGVFELLPGAEELRLVAGVGWPDSAVGVATVPTGVSGLSDYEVAWMAPVTVGSLDGSTRFLAASLLLEQGGHSGISVAIEGHASPFGVLTAFSTAPRTFGQADVNFLVAVANVVAAVVERRRAEEEVRHQALHDGLTGLPNRTLLADRLEQALAAALRDGTHVGLLLLDLDGFKDVNDSLGHHAGDQLLRQVSERLRATLRATDTVARLGGDEFAVCLPDLHSPAEASTLATKLLTVLQGPFDLAEMAVTLGASIGVAFSGEHGHEPSVLLQRADIAMYRAKRARCGWALYDTATDEAHRHRLAVLAELRDAAALGELELHYQPLVRLGSGAIEHVEALVRWVHPVRGTIAPGEFIPLAEQSGLIHPLTSWVLQSAIDQAARWSRDGIDLRIAVNLSAGVLQDENLPTVITDTLLDAGLPPDRLVVEITESVIAEEGVREALQRLADVGITCAVDDFGTGYSSLAWLKHLPVHQLKVDRAFVTDMAHDPRDRAIVHSVIQLAHSLGLQVVAEGIESEDVADLLADLGADFAQGFLFCKPLPAAELEAWLDAATAHPRRSGTIVE